MPIPGQRKAWKWLVGFVLVTVYGLIAAPASFSQTLICLDNEKEPTYIIEEDKPDPSQPSKCKIDEKPDITVEVSVGRTPVDCVLDIHPPVLHPGGGHKHSVILKDCVLLHERGKGLRVDVAQVVLNTVLLNTCDRWPDCLDEPEDFDDFQDGVSPEEGALRNCHRSLGQRCEAFEFRFNTEELFNLGCKSASSTSILAKRKLAVIGELQGGAKAIAKDGKTSVDVGGAFVRGLDAVVCLHKGP
jgi:hypothetical protein